MCIRKVFFCPDCRKYSKIPDVTVPSPAGSQRMVVYEEPCGFSYCDCFDQFFPWIERPWNPREVGLPCTSRCSIEKCQVLAVLESCCVPTSGVHYRLVTLKLIKEGYASGTRTLSRPQPQRPRAPLPQRPGVRQPSQPSRPLRLTSSEEVSAFLAKHCSVASCRNLYEGNTVLLSDQDLQYHLSGGRRGYIRVVVTSQNLSLEGFQEFDISYGWLLHRCFWREEEEKRRVDIPSLFR